LWPTHQSRPKVWSRSQVQKVNTEAKAEAKTIVTSMRFEPKFWSQVQGQKIKLEAESSVIRPKLKPKCWPRIQAEAKGLQA